jgi:hypothetical protein
MGFGSWATVGARFWLIDLVFDTCRFTKTRNMAVIKAGFAPHHGTTLIYPVIMGQTPETSYGRLTFRINLKMIHINV